MARRRRTRLYRLLLRVYPPSFAVRFGDAMERSFRAELEDADGRWRRARLWALSAWHVVVGAPVEWWAAATGRDGRRIGDSDGGGDGMGTIWRDLRHAARGLGRRPVFSAVVVGMLAVGIGAGTSIFSVVNGVLLDPLPYAEPDRLAFLWGRMEETSVSRAPFSGPDLEDFQARSELFDRFAGVFIANATLTGEHEAEQVRLGTASPGIFEMLGAAPVVGRALLPEDRYEMDPSVFNDPGAALPTTVAVLSHGLWQRRYGGDPDVVGRSVELNGQPMTVVGVAPPDFRLYLPADAHAGGQVDLWTPLPYQPSDGPRDAQWLTVIARLAEGGDWSLAQQEMDAIAADLRAEHQFHENVGMRIAVAPMHADVVGHTRPVLLALLGSVAFVLLIACANVANLLLVRASTREREIGVRRALGGSRRRVVRALLTESALYAALGGALGVALAVAGIDLLMALRPEDLPRAENVTLDGRVLLVTVATSCLAALLFGAVPALHATRGDVFDALRDRAGAGGADRSRRLRDGLVVVEVALCLVLLIGAGLMLRSFTSLRAVDPGYDPEDVLTLNVTAPFFEYRTNGDRVRLLTDIRDALAALPGVEHVGAVSPLPLAGGGQLWFGPYALTESDEEWSRNEGDYRVLLPGYFEAVGTEVLAGRTLEDADLRDDAAPVVVVDATAAERVWPGEDPVGRQIRVMRPGVSSEFMFDRFWATVVGVVEHQRYDDVRADGRETLYFPARDWSFAEMSFTVRSAVDPAELAPAARDAVSSVDPDVAPATVLPFADYVDRAMAPVRFALALIGVFAGVALLLATVGLYGVVSYAVSRRSREIGIRMAFGAERSRITGLVLARGMVLAAAGVALGLGGAALLTRMLGTLLFEVSPLDAATFVGLSVLVGGVAVLASWLPARRATRIDPSEALRAD